MGQETRYTYDSYGRLTEVQHWRGSPVEWDVFAERVAAADGGDVLDAGVGGDAGVAEFPVSVQLQPGGAGDGGIIDVRANDVKDTESRDQIRSHFHHIAQMFAEGNFNAPMLVHNRAVPGTATMTASRINFTGICRRPRVVRVSR